MILLNSVGCSKLKHKTSIKQKNKQVKSCYGRKANSCKPKKILVQVLKNLKIKLIHQHGLGLLKKSP